MPPHTTRTITRSSSPRRKRSGAERHLLQRGEYDGRESPTDLGLAGHQGRRHAGAILDLRHVERDGILYVGSISGTGTSNTVNYPGSRSSTSVYGPNNLGGGQVQLVGSYRTEGSSVVSGFFFQGTIANGTATGTYSTLDTPGRHSTTSIARWVAWPWATPMARPRTDCRWARACLHLQRRDRQPVTNVKFPGSISDTAYGIWYNGGTSYTIVGGFSNRPVNNMNDQDAPIGTGYMVDYNSAARTASRTGRPLPIPRAQLPHALRRNQQPRTRAFTRSVPTRSRSARHISPRARWWSSTRNRNGSFGNGPWVNLNYPGCRGLDQQRLGCRQSGGGNRHRQHGHRNTSGDDSPELSFQATVNAIVQSASVKHHHSRRQGLSTSRSDVRPDADAEGSVELSREDLVQ